MNSLKSLEFTWGFVLSAHHGQKYGDQDYVEHLRRVAWRVTEPLRIPALLHDVVEDTAFTLPFIKEHWGLEVGDTVGLLTRPGFMPYMEYIRWVSTSFEASLIKLADIADHLYHIEHVYPGQKWDRLKPRYEEARAFLLECWGQHPSQPTDQDL